jgi:hypothetical protein
MTARRNRRVGGPHATYHTGYQPTTDRTLARLREWTALSVFAGPAASTFESLPLDRAVWIVRYYAAAADRQRSA